MNALDEVVEELKEEEERVDELVEGVVELKQKQLSAPVVIQPQKFSKQMVEVPNVNGIEKKDVKKIDPKRNKSKSMEKPT
jgi:hypothetical protein